MNKKTIATKIKSGKTYVPPSAKVCPLDVESIMAVVGSPYIQATATGTNKSQGTGIPVGFEPAVRETLEEESSKEGGLFGN